MRKDIQKIYSKLVLNDTLISYRNVLTYPLNIYGLMESQFAKMRGLTDDYKEEMNFLIFCIKNDFMDSGKCDVKWLYYYFQSPEWKAFIESKIVKGSTVNRISVEDFPSYTVPLIDIKNQDKIVSILSTIDDKIENNNLINDNLAA